MPRSGGRAASGPRTRTTRISCRFINQMGGQSSSTPTTFGRTRSRPWRDLLDPRYTGKISVWNPTAPRARAGTRPTGCGSRSATTSSSSFTSTRSPASGRLAPVVGLAGARHLSDRLGAAARDIEALKRDEFRLEVLPAVLGGAWHRHGRLRIVVLLDDAPHPERREAIRELDGYARGTGDLGPRRPDSGRPHRPGQLLGAPIHVPRPEYQYLDGYDWTYVNTAFLESIAKIRQIMALRG